MPKLETDTSLFQAVVEKDFFGMFCGKRLGRGIGREVFECAIDPTMVVKIEAGAHSFQNVIEWETWEEVRGTDFEKWFAPCVNISACGSVMLQKKTKIIPFHRLPPKMPAFLGDFKRGNVGSYKGHIVAHDYGRTRIMTNGLTKRMRDVDWTDDLET